MRPMRMKSGRSRPRWAPRQVRDLFAASLGGLLLFLPPLALAPPAAAADVNFVTNSFFDQGVLGWNAVAAGAGQGDATEVNLVFDGSRDAAGDPSSGSAQLQVGRPQITSQSEGYVEQCVPIASGRLYSLRGFVLIPGPPAQDPPPLTTEFSAELQVRWHAETSCQSPLGGFLGGGAISWSGRRDSWQASEIVDLVAPPGAASLQLRGRLHIAQDQVGQTHLANFDSIVVVPEPGAPLAGLMATAALGWLRARRRRIGGQPGRGGGRP